jgi:DNA-binding transcriptional ArsR family regulator
MKSESGVAERDPLSEVFGALADPTRRAILRRLAQGEASVAELGEPFAMSQPAISKHLRVLERAGLISRSRSSTMRLSRLETARLQEASEWVETYKRFWDSSFDRLDDALRAFSTHEKSSS